MVVVPAGSFIMGSPANEAARSKDEGPQHEVTIHQPFAVSKFESTFDEWAACVANGGCDRTIIGHLIWGYSWGAAAGR
jgi:formylglycine-generating enzyme required for sulfatase activity